MLNATSLNTGRVWQFTAKTMSEPPIDGEPLPGEKQSSGLTAYQIDKKTIRLRRANGYADITSLQQEFPLGQMDMVKQLDTGPASVLLRVSAVLQDRVRTEGLLRLVGSYGGENIAFLSHGIHCQEKHGEK